MSLMMPASLASSVSRSAEVVRTISAGWAYPGRQPGQMRANSRVASGSHDQCRLLARSGRAARSGGMAGVTSKRRTGRMAAKVTDRLHLLLGDPVARRPAGARIRGLTGGRRRRSPWLRRWRATSSGRRAARRPACASRRRGSRRSARARCTTPARLRCPARTAGRRRCPSTSSASPPVRATTSGAPPASASRATMPNGSYSDGMTTHPARWTVSRSWSSGRKPGRSMTSLTPSRSICDCSSGR